jgi:integrase
MAKALTQLAVKAARPKRNAAGVPTRAEYPDAACPGLYLIVQTSGRRSWALRYRRPDGKSAKLTLGPASDTAGALTLASARKAAADARSKLEHGTDPAEERQKAKAESARLAALRATDSVEALAEQFLSLYAKPRTRPRTCRQTVDVLHRLTLPVWRGRTVHDIRRRDVIALIDDNAAERGSQMAGKALAVLGKFFAWLIARDVVAVSPCHGVERPANNPPRDRVLDDDEIAALWLACGEEGTGGAVVRLLLLTGCRRSEVVGMRWSEVDAAELLWKLPRERVKNGMAHVVPLSVQAWAIVAAQPRFAGCDFVFTTDGRRSIGGFSRLKRNLDARTKFTRPWTFHDLRRTAASGMQRVGVGVKVIEQVLNHRSGAFRGIVGVYQRHDYLDERRAALQRWADRVAGGKPAKSDRTARQAAMKRPAGTAQTPRQA